MSSATILAFFVASTQFGVALHDSGALSSREFPNSPEGVASMERWLVSAIRANDVVIHSCVAIHPEASPAGYQSAAMAFAYDNTVNTFVWNSQETLSLLSESGPLLAMVAEHMIPACVKQHLGPAR
jgi:hypothetical protein